MKTYLYLSLIPEALVASHLPPEEFGNYYAVGSQKRSRGQAVFFEVDPDLKSDYLRLGEVMSRCVPHEDGSPRRSSYVCIYRALEHVPLRALGRLYLATDDGRVLALDPGSYQAPTRTDALHVYQEICPVTPLVASKLAPDTFAKYITDRTNPVSVDKIVFTELLINGLGEHPETASAANLPYSNLDHLRDCLKELRNRFAKPTKVIARDSAGLLYRTIAGGFYAADKTGLVFYPMPTRDELETRYYAWWRSAISTFVR